jgi:hypothetical protein
MSRSRLEKFKAMADFDWNWPDEIDRPCESLLSLDFVEARATSCSLPMAAWARR